MKMTPSEAEECLILPLSGFITTKYLRKKIIDNRKKTSLAERRRGHLLTAYNAAPPETPHRLLNPKWVWK